MTQPDTGRSEQHSGALNAVRLDQVAQRLGGRWAVRGVSLEIAAGELVAMIGHNGSGKTTLLRLISTALRATRGNGSVFGHDLRRAPDDVRRVVTMLANGGGLYDDLTAAENLVFAQRMLGASDDRALIMEALEWAGIAQSSDMRVRTFSSGMRRRCALAAVYLRHTPLLLMDEPYNSLDPAGGVLIDELLLNVRRRGGAALVVLHDRARAGVHFDRVIEMADGRIVREHSAPVAGDPRPALTLAR